MKICNVRRRGYGKFSSTISRLKALRNATNSKSDFKFLPPRVPTQNMRQKVPESHCGISLQEDASRPDYANETVFRRNTLPTRSYHVPETSLSLNGHWDFHLASTPLEAPEPSVADSVEWEKLHVRALATSRLWKAMLHQRSVSHPCLPATRSY